MPQGFNILVIWDDGQEEFIAEGIEGKPVVFHSKSAAIEHAEFMRMGMEGFQSISVVKAESQAHRRERR